MNLTMPDEKRLTVNGLNGFPIVDGAAFLYDNSVYAYATSHSALLNIRD